MTLRPITAAMPRNPIPCALVAGIIAKATQIAFCSFFRDSPRLISLITRASQFPGGQTLLNWGPTVVIALATGALLRLYTHTPSVNPIIPARKTVWTVDGPFHQAIDRDIKEEAQKPGRSMIFKHWGANWIGYVCSNYPKKEADGHGIFCDAFSYVENDEIQIAAIADGNGWGKSSQRAARAIVDGFMHFCMISDQESPAEKLVMDAAQDSQTEIEKSHKRHDPDRSYGGTTFLGGLIFKAADGKRYFTGVNCGDCKLYHHKKNGTIVELTKPARTDATDPGGRFGPNRTEGDKTEYAFSVEVQPGDQLFFMTDGVHDNLDQNPPEKDVKEALGVDDQRKLLTLKQFPKNEDVGQHIINFAHTHSEKYLIALENFQNMKNASRKEYPGKPDHMTLLVVVVK